MRVKLNGGLVSAGAFDYFLFTLAMSLSPSLKQLPAFECQNVYQDCARYTCTGLGPG